MTNINENLKVLIVEDMAPMRAALRSILESVGITYIVEAVDGSEGLEFFLSESKREHPFSLIISDINMPNMNGTELLKSIREFDFGKDIPIVMMTTVSEKDVVVDCILAGANDYIIKPYDQDQVAKKILDIVASVTKPD